MYIIELLIKKFSQKKESPAFTPLENQEQKEYENCEHIFMPIDSTGEILSCTKCGFLTKRSELKNVNFFKI